MIINVWKVAAWDKNQDTTIHKLYSVITQTLPQAEIPFHSRRLM
jgi:hypothetical protein